MTLSGESGRATGCSRPDPSAKLCVVLFPTKFVDQEDVSRRCGAAGRWLDHISNLMIEQVDFPERTRSLVHSRASRSIKDHPGPLSLLWLLVGPWRRDDRSASKAASSQTLGRLTSRSAGETKPSKRARFGQSESDFDWSSSMGLNRSRARTNRRFEEATAERPREDHKLGASGRNWQSIKWDHFRTCCASLQVALTHSLPVRQSYGRRRRGRPQIKSARDEYGN